MPTLNVVPCLHAGEQAILRAKVGRKTYETVLVLRGGKSVAIIQHECVTKHLIKLTIISIYIKVQQVKKCMH